MKYFLPVIRKSSILAGLEDKEIMKILDCTNASVISKEKGSYIYRAGEPSTEIYLIVSGTVNIVQTDIWGTASLLYKYGRGDIIGEAIASRQEFRMNLSAVAETDCKIIVIDLRKLLTKCSKCCEFHQHVIFNYVGLLGDKLQSSNDRLNHTCKSSTRDKLLSYLSSESIKRVSLSFDIPYDRQGLADFLNISRPNMSVELSKLEKEGLLKTHRKHFELFIVEKKDEVL